MLVRCVTDVKQDKVQVEGAKGARIRWLISKSDDAPNFAMREFEIEPGGYSPYHSHDWEHEVYVLAGEGAVVSQKGEAPIKAGMTVFVSPGEMHNFKNTGQETLRFLCLVPHQKD